MDDACGFSPDYIGAEYDDQISDLEYERDNAEAKIQYLKQLRDQ
jgi:hypothetical protein